MQAWGITDTGNVRTQNQDYYQISEIGKDTLLAVVCDGMGGAKSGNVASRLACEVFTEEILRSYKKDMTAAEADRLLRQAAGLANVSVYEHAQLSEEFRGMGTTLVAVLLRPEEALVINIGDSRAYYIDPDGVRCVTTDHSVVQYMVSRGELTPEQAKSHPKKNMITRAVGPMTQVLPDVFTLPVHSGDFFLLCSDGLSNQMADQEILFEVVHGVRQDDCCQRLLDIAKERGAPDNVTCILVAV
ncbi:MAG: Stp1/IreP family PP2C-type Ser/Thr phosphatase [Oscillospiraceae bacterium]|nr:Stp1/IreP family PP2C-type Ser/Thr phosphatase [Oscillospiraceae bacterium]